MLSGAHRALPEVVRIGKWLKHFPENKLYDMVDNIKAVGGCMDERLALQYVLSTLCAKKLVLCVCGKLSSSENIVTSFVIKIARMAKYSLQVCGFTL